MNAFLSSPVWATVLAVAGSAVTALIALAMRLNSKMDIMADAIKDIQQDVTDIKNDKNIVRWSDIGPMRIWRRKNVI